MNTIEQSPHRLALPYRIVIAVGYAGVGGFLFREFAFSPWYPAAWVFFCIVVGWAALGVCIDPFRFGSPVVPRPAGRNGRFIQRWPILVLAALLLLPAIAWSTGCGWFFPWYPWGSLAPYWIVREVLLSGSFAVCVRLIWSTFTPGRQLCLLLGFLLSSHVGLLLTYAAMSGTSEYLQDGATADSFLKQLWFKTAVGISIFIGLEIRSRRRLGSKMV